MAMNSINEPDDDPIVAEHNVYLSHHASRKLFLLDYVSNLANRPYDTNDAMVKVKPNIPKIEFQLPLQDCQEYLRDQDFKLILSSKKASVNNLNCAFGVLINDNFHLCSSPDVLQMTANLDEYSREHRKTEDEHEIEGDADKSKMTLVTAKVAPRQSEVEKKKEMMSYENMKLRENREPWINVATKTAESHDINSIICHNTKSVESEFNMSRDCYFQQLLSSVKKDGNDKMRNVTECVSTATSSTPNDATISDEKLVSFVKEKLTARTIMTLKEFQTQMNMACYLMKTNQQLIEAITQAGGVNISTSKANPIFAIKHKGDKKDPIRECLVNMLLNKPVLKMSLFKSMLEKNGISNLSDNELKTVLKEYCTTKGGSWISKGQLEDNSQKSKKLR